MTNEGELNRMIAVLNAFRDGKTIEWTTRGFLENWEDCTSPSWNWRDFVYRIKPEPRKPREFWLTPVGTAEHIRVREVLPGDGA